MGPRVMGELEMGGQAGYPRTRSGRPVGGSARARGSMPTRGLHPQTVPLAGLGGCRNAIFRKLKAQLSYKHTMHVC